MRYIKIKDDHWDLPRILKENTKVNQAYSRLSTTSGHITDCKLDSVVYAGGCV